MATLEQRYNAATDYVRRAIREVERGPLHTWASIVPAVFATEVYAGQVKTENVENELKRIEERWLRAANEIERARVARDAELLADRTEENLPGAPTDWKRTNLTKTELPRTTPATTYANEVEHQAEDAWSWTKEQANRAKKEASALIEVLLLGGGLYFGIKVFDFMKAREIRKTAEDDRTRRSTRLSRLPIRRENTDRSPS